MTVTAMAQLLAEIQPHLNPGEYTFCTLPAESVVPSSAISVFLEAEGKSIILPVQDAQRLGYIFTYRAAWITLQLYSDLTAVGLTAKVSTALANADISCNIIAGYHHDHLFVPVHRADEAMAILNKLTAPKNLTR